MTFHSVLVTGANRGIGLQFIIELLKQNPTHLIATCRNVANATELNELAAKHSNLRVLQLDMTDYSRHDALVAEVEKIVGEKGLQFLVQNAGINIHDEDGGQTRDALVKMFDTNAVSPLLLTRKFLPLLQKSGKTGARTLVAFIGSLLGSVELNVMPKMIGYRMSKSALNQGVRTLALELKDEPIHFVVLHPGHVATDMGTYNNRIKAPVTKEISVQGMLKYLADDKLITDGRVLTWEGNLLPW